jgi:hypothetical protein
MGMRQDDLPVVAEPDIGSWLLVIDNKSLSKEGQ